MHRAPFVLSVTGFPARAIALVGLALVLSWQLGEQSDALAATALLVVVAGALLAPPCAAGPWACPAWCLATGLVATALAAAGDASAAQGLRLGVLAAGQSLVLLTAAGPRTAATPVAVLRRRLWAGVLVVLLATSVLWLAPLLEAAGATAAFPGLAAANPWVHLGTALAGDPLRGDWLYRHSPLGSYPTAHLSPGAVIAATWTVATLSWGVTEYRRRRRPA